MKRKPRKGKIVAAARDSSGRLKPTAAETKLRNASMATLRKLVAAEEKRDAARQAKLDREEAKKFKAGQKAREKADKDEEKALAKAKTQAERDAIKAQAKLDREEEKKWKAGAKVSAKANAVEEFHQAAQEVEAAAIKAAVQSFQERPVEQGGLGRPKGEKVSKAKAASAAKSWYRGLLDEAIKGAVNGAKKNLIDRMMSGARGK